MLWWSARRLSRARSNVYHCCDHFQPPEFSDAKRDESWTFTPKVSNLRLVAISTKFVLEDRYPARLGRCGAELPVVTVTGRHALLGMAQRSELVQKPSGLESLQPSITIGR